MQPYRLTADFPGYPAGSVLLGWRSPKSGALHIYANGREWTVEDGQAVPVDGAVTELEKKPDARAEEYQSATGQAKTDKNKGRPR